MSNKAKIWFYVTVIALIGVTIALIATNCQKEEKEVQTSSSTAITMTQEVRTTTKTENQPKVQATTLILVDTAMYNDDKEYPTQMLECIQYLKKQNRINDQALFVYGAGTEVTYGTDISMDDFGTKNMKRWMDVLDVIFRSEAYKQSEITDFIIISDFQGPTGQVSTWDNFLKHTKLTFVYPEKQHGASYEGIVKNLYEPLSKDSDESVDGTLMPNIKVPV